MLPRRSDVVYSADRLRIGTKFAGPKSLSVGGSGGVEVEVDKLGGRDENERHGDDTDERSGETRLGTAHRQTHHEAAL